MVELGVVEDDSVAQAGVQVEKEPVRDHVGIDSVREIHPGFALIGREISRLFPDWVRS